MVAYKTQRGIYLFILLISVTFGQSQTLDTNKNIKLKPGSHRLDSLLLFASQQTGAVFSYNSKKINTHQHILLKDGIISITKILALLKEGNNVSIKIVENYIIITPTGIKHSDKKIPVKLAASPRVIDPSHLKINQIQNSTADAKNTDKVKIIPNYDSLKIDSIPKEELKNEDTTAFADSTKANHSTIQPLLPIAMPPSIPVDSEKKSATKAIPPKENSTRPEKKLSKPKPLTNKISFFLKSGIAVDESLYTGFLAQVGMPLLYGTISANTNFSVSQIRYGLGTSFKINNKLELHFNFNLGDLQRSGQFSDSSRTKFPIAVKSQLTRYMIAVEFSPSKKLKIQIGPVFNQLKTNYFINSVPSDLHIFKENGDHLFYTINPPYVITNTYSSTSSSNIKTWIGLQVNVLYFLKF